MPSTARPATTMFTGRSEGSILLEVVQQRADAQVEQSRQRQEEYWRTHNKDPSHLCCNCLSIRLVLAMENDELPVFQELCRRIPGIPDTSQVELGRECGDALLLCIKRGGPQVLPFVRVLLSDCCTRLTFIKHFNKEDDEFFAIHYAGFRREEDLVRELLRRCPEDCRLREAEAAFSVACATLCTGMMTTLLRGEDVSEEQEKQGLGSIPRVDPYAVKSGDGEPVVFNIIKLGTGRPEVVEAMRMLVQELGLDILYCPSKDGLSLPLLAMVMVGSRLDVLRMLVDEFNVHELFYDGRWQQTDERDEDYEIRRFQALHGTAFVGHLDILCYLVEDLKMPTSLEGIIRNEDDDSLTIRGTPLHVAAGSYCVDEHILMPVVEWLVEHGLDPEIKNATGQTAAELAQQRGHNKIYAFLTRQKRAEEAEAARMALLAELDAEDEMQAKKKEKNKKKKEKKKQQQKKKGTENAKEEENVTSAAAAMGGLRLFDNDEAAVEKSDMQDDDVPAAFLCGLTRKLLHHPVVAQDGVSYEAAALEKYISQTKATGKPLVSPSTGESMGEMSLPNHLLRTQIEEWVEEEKKK